MPDGPYSRYVDDRYPLEGFYVRRPAFMRLAARIATVVVERHGYEPVLLPTLIPEWVISAEVEHIDGFEPAVYWVTEKGCRERLRERVALAISSETIFVLTFRDWLADGAALPLRLYQQRTVFRAESRNVSPLLREREFPWFEAHTAFATRTEIDAQIAADTAIVHALADALGFPVERALRAPADKCPGAERTYGFDVPSGNGEPNQIASTHDLGQRFARVFDFRTPGGEHAYQTSFGIGLSRLVAAVADHNPDF